MNLKTSLERKGFLFSDSSFNLSRILTLLLLAVFQLPPNRVMAANKKYAQNSQLINVLKPKVEKIGTNALQVLNDVVLTGNIDASRQKLGLSAQDATRLQKQLELSKAKSDFLEKIGEKYKNLRSTYSIQDFKYINNQVVLTVKELTEIDLKNPEPNITPKYINTHKFVFGLSGTNLSLLSHELIDSPLNPSLEDKQNAKPAPPDAIPATVDLPNNVTQNYQFSYGSLTTNSSLKWQSVASQNWISEKHAKSSINRQIFFKDSQVLPASFKSLFFASNFKNQLISQSRTWFLQRPVMVSYAKQWWNGFNSEYRDYTNSGGDCTNYASQILFAGGWPHVSGPHDVQQSWWYDKAAFTPIDKRQSNSWSNAGWFYDFLRVTPSRATPANKTSLLNIGDVVQVDFGCGSLLSHTMIVTDKRASDGMIYLTGHTQPRLSLPVYDIISSKPCGVVPKLYVWQLKNEGTY
jgi:hypothetical protein